MLWRALASTLAFGLLAAPAFAAPTCTNTTPLGTISAPNVADFSGSFGAPGQYIECFTFTPSMELDGKIHVSDFDVGNNQLDIDLTRIELYNGADLVASAPKQFDFGSLQSGVTYTLALHSDVSPSKGGPRNDEVSYKGRIESEPHVVVNQVPEPGVLALLGIALVACGALALRKRPPSTAGETQNPA